MDRHTIPLPSISWSGELQYKELELCNRQCRELQDAATNGLMQKERNKLTNVYSDTNHELRCEL